MLEFSHRLLNCGMISQIFKLGSVNNICFITVAENMNSLASSWVIYQFQIIGKYINAAETLRIFRPLLKAVSWEFNSLLLTKASDGRDSMKMTLSVQWKCVRLCLVLLFISNYRDDSGWSWSHGIIQWSRN